MMCSRATGRHYHLPHQVLVHGQALNNITGSQDVACEGVGRPVSMLIATAPPAEWLSSTTRLRSALRRKPKSLPPAVCAKSSSVPSSPAVTSTYAAGQPDPAGQAELSDRVRYPEQGRVSLRHWVSFFSHNL